MGVTCQILDSYRYLASYCSKREYFSHLGSGSNTCLRLLHWRGECLRLTGFEAHNRQRNHTTSNNRQHYAQTDHTGTHMHPLNSLIQTTGMWFQRSNTNSSNTTVSTITTSSSSTAGGMENLENSASSLMSVQQLLEDQAERFRNDTDVRFLIEDPEKFAKLQRDLRRSGAVTNGVLKHGIHFYARDQAEKEERRRRRRRRSSSRNRSHAG